MYIKERRVINPQIFHQKSIFKIDKRRRQNDNYIITLYMVDTPHCVLYLWSVLCITKFCFRQGQIEKAYTSKM